MDAVIMLREDDEKEKGVELSQEKGTYVLDLSGLDLPLAVKESFAHEIEEIEALFKVDYEGVPKLKPGEDGKMMELVSKEFIHKLMESPPRSTPFPGCSVGAIGRSGITDEALEVVARGFRAMETARVIENDIIQQYRDSGYAYIELADN